MADYGKKFTCFKCGCKFYDLHKPKALCPKCGADQSEYKPPVLRSAAGKKSHAPRREEVIEEEAIGIEDVGEFVAGELTEEAEEDLGFEGEAEAEGEDDDDSEDE